MSGKQADVAISPLRAEIAQQIVQIAREESWEEGTRLSDQALAKRLGVSRTPVRAALALLQGHGIVAAQPGQGFSLVQSMSLIADAIELPASAAQEAYEAIRHDRALNRLPREVSEAELSERYPYPRGLLKSALMQMASEGLVKKQRGHGWEFAETLDTRDRLDRSLRFRLVVECGAMLEDTFSFCEEEWQHLATTNRQLLDRSSIDPANWLLINRHFHETIASWSNNSYFLDAVQQHSNLRHFREQALAREIDIARIKQLCEEHLTMLHAIRDGDNRYASELMRHHLSEARKRALARHDLLADE